MKEPIVIDYVGRVVEGNDGLEVHFDVEGGISALEAGCSLYASVDLQNAGLTDEDGSCEVYNASDFSRPVFDPSAFDNLDALDDDLSTGAIVMRSHPSIMLPDRPRADEDEYERMTDYDKGLLHGGIELWDKIDKMNRGTVIGFDQGEPGGDRTVLSVFERDGDSLKLLSLLSSVADRQIDGVVCAASVGGVHCQSIRQPGSLFCANHQRAKSRMYLPKYADEQTRGLWAATVSMSLEEARKLYPSQEEPPCPFCFQRGCNGECHGDDMMGDS
jgi:hypothetical protein